jgi:hypothetical protein
MFFMSLRTIRTCIPRTITILVPAFPGPEGTESVGIALAGALVGAIRDILFVVVPGAGTIELSAATTNPEISLSMALGDLETELVFILALSQC